jgi:hypothetical protein
VNVPLLLDEMHAPGIAAALRERGHDVVAVVEGDALRAMTDEELFRWAAEHGRRIVTENVTDFAPLVRRAEEAGHQIAAALFTSSRTFPRSRRNPGPIIRALDAWLTGPAAVDRPVEDWLQRP